MDEKEACFPHSMSLNNGILYPPKNLVKDGDGRHYLDKFDGQLTSGYKSQRQDIIIDSFAFSRNHFVLILVELDQNWIKMNIHLPFCLYMKLNKKQIVGYKDL